MLLIENIDLDMLASALADHGYEHEWTIDPESGEILTWTDGIDDEPDEDALRIEALPSRVWYSDMADFTARVGDERVAERLERSLAGRGAFRRFRDEIYGRQPNLIGPWNAFRTTRAERRAVEWLRDNKLVDDAAADRYLAAHPDPDVP